MSKQIDLLKNPRIDFCVKEHFDFIGNFGHNRRRHRFDLINSSNFTSFGESMSLSCIRPIHNEASRLCHIAREEEASFDVVYSIFIRRSQ